MNVLAHLSAYLAANTPELVTVMTRDGNNAYSGVQILAILDDGVLIQPSAEDATFKQYLPMGAIGVIMVQE